MSSPHHLMYDYFFEDYKDKIYKVKYQRRLNSYEWSIFILMLLLTINLLISVIVHRGQGIMTLLYSMPPFIFTLISICVIMKHGQERFRQERSSWEEWYYANKLIPLMAELDARNCNNEAMLSWLIDCCNTKSGLQRSVKSFSNFFFKMIFPIIAFCAAIFVSKLDLFTIFYLAGMVILILLLVYILVHTTAPDLRFILDRDKHIAETMKTDLEYLLACVKAGSLPQSKANCARYTPT